MLQHQYVDDDLHYSLLDKPLPDSVLRHLLFYSHSLGVYAQNQ